MRVQLKPNHDQGKTVLKLRFLRLNVEAEYSKRWGSRGLPLSEEALGRNACNNRGRECELLRVSI